MKNDIQKIIQQSAERYGLEYNPHSTTPTFREKDGTVKELTVNDFEKVFGVKKKN